jgi:hypothetical protein
MRNRNVIFLVKTKTGCSDFRLIEPEQIWR